MPLVPTSPPYKTLPFLHQIKGTQAIVDNRSFYLADEMGAGKSKQTIDAACALFRRGKITKVIIVVPASVRSVWIDPDPEEPGEIKKHSSVPSHVIEYHALQRGTHWREVWSDDGETKLNWIVTNYEFLRHRNVAKQSEHLERLLGVADSKTMVVFDEGSFIKSRTAHQTKAAALLRRACGRAVVLNGTPITKDPLDLWAQFNVLDPMILGRRYDNFYHFRATYAIMGGFENKQVIKWKNLERLQQILKPYILRRLKKNCLDLPEKIYMQPREIALTENTWKIYRQMRDEAIAFLEPQGNASVAPQSVQRILRLRQITGGNLGGLRSDEDPEPRTVNISTEKLDWLEEEIKRQLDADPVWRAIIWFQFRPERELAFERLAGLLPTVQIYGDQQRTERDEAVKRFSSNDGTPGVCLGQPQAGGLGLNLVGAWNSWYFSNSDSLWTRLQSEDRQHRPGQVRNVIYLDLVATGPKGQRTVDHTVLRNLKKKEDLATWTCARWVQALKEEKEEE